MRFSSIQIGHAPAAKKPTPRTRWQQPRIHAHAKRTHTHTRARAVRAAVFARDALAVEANPARIFDSFRLAFPSPCNLGTRTRERSKAQSTLLVAAALTTTATITPPPLPTLHRHSTTTAPFYLLEQLQHPQCTCLALASSAV